MLTGALQTARLGLAGSDTAKATSVYTKLKDELSPRLQQMMMNYYRSHPDNYVTLMATYKNRRFTVLGVSLDSKAQKLAWLRAIGKDRLNWTQVSDLKGWGNEVAKLYAVQSIPQNFLIDPNGIIVAKNLRGADLEKKLSEIFK